jgi:hypothetical protein
MFYVKLIIPGGSGNGHYLGVFACEVVAGLQDVAVVRLGEQFAILDDAGGGADLDRASVEHLDAIHECFFG